MWIRTSNTEEPQQVTVIRKGDEPDSYLIERRDRTVRGNRKHLIKRLNRSITEVKSQQLEEMEEEDSQQLKQTEKFMFQRPHGEGEENGAEDDFKVPVDQRFKGGDKNGRE